MSSIVVSLVLISDTTIAGILVGDKAVAGINLVAPAYSLAASFGMIFALGAPILYSKAVGSFNKKEADHVFRFGLTATLGSGILLFLIFLSEESSIFLPLMLRPRSLTMPGTICSGYELMSFSFRYPHSFPVWFLQTEMNF